MSECVFPDLYENMKVCIGEKSLPGVRAHVYIIPKADIAAWPELPALDDDDVELEDVATYDGDFTLAASKFWKKIELRENVNGIVSEAQGEDGSKSFKDTATLIYPGTTAQAAGFCRQIVNDDVVIAVPQRDGKIRILGNEQFRTQVNPSMDTGKASTDASQTQIEASVDTICPAPFYPGKLMLSSTTYIDGATDKEQAVSPGG